MPEATQPPALTPTESFYATLLDPDDRAVYDRASSDPDLSGDIRLLRTLIARLAQDGGLRTKEAAIRQAIGILYRLVQVQNKLGDEEGEFELGIEALRPA